jgi:hypothetical protein
MAMDDGLSGKMNGMPGGVPGGMFGGIPGEVYGGMPSRIPAGMPRQPFIHGLFCFILFNQFEFLKPPKARVLSNHELATSCSSDQKRTKPLTDSIRLDCLFLLNLSKP